MRREKKMETFGILTFLSGFKSSFSRTDQQKSLAHDPSICILTNPVFSDLKARSYRVEDRKEAYIEGQRRTGLEKRAEQSKQIISDK